MKDIDVIGLGVSTIDILNVVDHFNSEEEVQRAVETAIDGGGPVATAIVTLARLGAKVMMIDSVGNDWCGKLIIDGFKKENILTDYIKINKGCTSSTATILVRKIDGARTIIYSPGNAPEVPENEITPELISRTKYIHLNGRHFNACVHSCMIARECSTKISFDGGSHRFNNELKKIIPLTDVCILAKDFAFNYSNKTNINDSAEEILKSGPEIVIITDGLNGSWLFTKEISGFHQKAFVMQNKVDTTGCGDSFHGAFIFGLCKGYDLPVRQAGLFECMKIASAVAAINSTKLGGRTGLPTFEYVLEFLRNSIHT